MKSYDLIVLGGGSGGNAAALKAARLGLSCAVIESAEVLGGLCILRGCMPSKTLIESANRVREIRDGQRFGIEVSGHATPDVAAIRERVKTLVADFQSSRVEDMESGVYELLRGEAEFTSSHEISFKPHDGSPAQSLSAKAFVIATGSHATIPEIEGLEDTRYWTSDDVVQLPSIPKSLVVVGGGAIGMECAHLFEGFGSKVTVLVRSGSILREFDSDVAKALEAESSERGIDIRHHAELAKVSHREGEGFTLELKGGGSLSVEALLIAAGRKPNTAMVKQSGVELAKDGRIVIDRHARTSVTHIYAAGDCASPLPVVHLAVIQGEAAAYNIARALHGGGGKEAAWEEESAMVAIFTEPQAARIGPDDETLRKRGYDPVSGRQDYSDFGKGMIVGDRHGFAKITVDRTSGLILSTSAVGPQVAETAHLLQFAISRRLTLEEYLELPHYHPTLIEAWQRAAEDAAEKRSQQAGKF